MPIERGRHNPEGKVKLKILSDVKGDALFSRDEKYRYTLTRSWNKGKGNILWIGMNPSTATADVDDPTVRREVLFSMKWGYRKYIKCNIMDYRATHPPMLLQKNVAPCSKKNLSYILKEAKKADKIIFAYGNLKEPLQKYADKIIETLEPMSKKIFIFGNTKNGNPRHPLYIKNTAKLIKWKRTDK